MVVKLTAGDCVGSSYQKARQLQEGTLIVYVRRWRAERTGSSARTGAVAVTTAGPAATTFVPRPATTSAAASTRIHGTVWAPCAASATKIPGGYYKDQPSSEQRDSSDRSFRDRASAVVDLAVNGWEGIRRYVFGQRLSPHEDQCALGRSHWISFSTSSAGLALADADGAVDLLRQPRDSEPLRDKEFDLCFSAGARYFHICIRVIDSDAASRSAMKLTV